jgi:hypothetical protein
LKNPRWQSSLDRFLFCVYFLWHFIVVRDLFGFAVVQKRRAFVEEYTERGTFLLMMEVEKQPLPGEKLEAPSTTPHEIGPPANNLRPKDPMLPKWRLVLITIRYATL